MKQKTAMQELIEYADTFAFMDKTALSYVKAKAIELLQKEKEQMIDAWDDGLNKGYTGNPGDAQKYFTQTFEQ